MNFRFYLRIVDIRVDKIFIDMYQLYCSNQRSTSHDVTPPRPGAGRIANFKRRDGDDASQKSTVFPSPNNTVFFQRIEE